MKKTMDIYRAEKIFHILFYGGLACMLLSLAMGQSKGGPLMFLLGAVGVVATFGGLIFGFYMIRCPDCKKGLTVGRSPGIPKFCPHCGKQLKEDA